MIKTASQLCKFSNKPNLASNLASLFLFYRMNSNYGNGVTILFKAMIPTICEINEVLHLKVNENIINKHEKKNPDLETLFLSAHYANLTLLWPN